MIKYRLLLLFSIIFVVAAYVGNAFGIAFLYDAIIHWDASSPQGANSYWSYFILSIVPLLWWPEVGIIFLFSWLFGFEYNALWENIVFYFDWLTDRCREDFSDRKSQKIKLTATQKKYNNESPQWRRDFHQAMKDL